MGKGGNDPNPPQIMETPRPFIPGEQQFGDATQHRIASASPWTSSPYRAMDFLFGLPSQGMQVPQFQPPQGMAQFNPGHGGGYGQGSPMGGPAPQWPMYMPPALTYAGGQQGKGAGPKPMAPPIQQAPQQMVAQAPAPTGGAPGGTQPPAPQVQQPQQQGTA